MTFLQMLKGVLDTMKTAKELLPEGKQRELATTISNAEKQISRAEVEFAQAIGYPICKCTWPPTIMVLSEQDDHEERFACSSCSHTETRRKKGAPRKSSPLEPESLLILRGLAQLTSTDEPPTGEQLAQALEMPYQKCQFFVDALCDNDLVNKGSYIGRPHRYSLGKKGRKVLAEQDLL